MKHRWHIRILAISLLAAFLALSGCGEGEKSSMVGKPAPELAGKDLDGKEVSLRQYLGKVVVVDVWATWCGPCRAMIPHERELVERLKDKPFVLISVSADRDKEKLLKFLENEPMPWVHWWRGQEGVSLADWEVSHLPSIFVLDHKGVVRFTDVRGKKMDKAVDRLLAEMGAAR